MLPKLQRDRHEAQRRTVCSHFSTQKHYV